MPGDPRDAPRASGGAARTSGDRTVGGRYRLQSVLGRGGMGVVWAARDEVLGRTVAVKEVIAPSGLDDAERALLRARTLREARTAAKISAEGVVAILDVVEDDGRPWIVMECLPPRTLEHELTERGGIPPGEVAGIARSLLAGLSAAHAAGILHRDVKPSNVMFRETPRGRRAVLGDFGIAHVDGDATLTATGQMMGSPAYIAPERARGEHATAASDLWSLGVTLWAAVEGWSPFQRVNSLASLTAVITEEPTRAEHAGPLQPLLEGLLRKDPAERIDAATARRLLAEVPVPEPVAVPAPVPATPAALATPPTTPPVPGPASTPTPVPVPVPVPEAVAASVAAPSIPPRVTTAAQPTAAPEPRVAPAADATPTGATPADTTLTDTTPTDTPPWWTPASVPQDEEPHRRQRRLLPVVVGAVTLGLVVLGATVLDDRPGGDGAQTTASGESPGPDPSPPTAGSPEDGASGGAAEDPASAGPSAGGSTQEGATAGGATGAGADTAGTGADGTGPGADPATTGEGGTAGGTDPAAVDPATAAASQAAAQAAAQAAQAAAAAEVPPGFERHQDPTGFSVAVPAGWQPEREGSRVYLHDPESSAYLLVDQTDDPRPDVVADWQQQEPGVARRQEGYRRIGEIRPVDYRGWQAADWEFVFGPGERTHVLNRNVITSPGTKAYALYWSVPSSRWDAMLPIHAQVVASFQPAG